MQTCQHGPQRPARLLPALALLARRERGATAIAFGVMATALMGFAGLATEGGSWYLMRREAQTAADTAAQAGAIAALFNRDPIAAARETSARNRFAHAVHQTTVTVNHPPSAGPNAGNPSAVETIIERQVPLQLAALFLGGPATIRTRAVAMALPITGGAACILALGAAGGQLTQEYDLEAGGNAAVNAPGCSLASNTSIRQLGSSSIRAFTMSAVGTVTISNPNNVVLQRPAASFQPPIADPFAPGVPGTGIPLPAQNGTCNHTNYGVNTNQSATMTAGRYCGGITLKGTVTMTPGVYVIQNGNLDVSAQAKICCPSCSPGNGVTFVFTGNPGTVGGPKINGSAEIDLIGGADVYRGILMYQDPRAAAGNDVRLNGGAGITTQGLFYFPSADLKINGNFGGVNSTCKAFIAESIDLVGTTTQTITVSGCAALGLDPENDLPQIRIVRLVE
jgi:hypothetical protein